MRVFDITDEKRSEKEETFQTQRDSLGKTCGRFGAHHPHECGCRDSQVHAAWFSGRLRVIDRLKPFSPREPGCYILQPRQGEHYAQINDVFMDDHGYTYLIDRIKGLDIFRFTREDKSD